ncbi:MAG: PTS sugar transporter subunit IIA [Legionellaceae bacterium]|nr:PTS sugar transporter subunit IIA [Legionellaceae bacterium]
MTFHDILNTNNICIDSTSTSKSAVLLGISKLLNCCFPELNHQELFQAYWERENLGSTTIGHGILIPHICLPSINSTYACFVKLDNPVNFDADDKQPIDLVFGLASSIVDPDKHLQLLSRIVTIFKDPEFVTKCRSADTTTDLYNLLTKETVT